MAFFGDMKEPKPDEYDYAVYFRSKGATIKGECRAANHNHAVNKVRTAATAEGAPIDGAILVRIK